MLQLLTADPDLGRVDLFSFSDQTLMEMVIADFPDGDKATYQDDEGQFLDVCDWLGLKCDAAKRVEGIRYAFENKPIELRYIPSSVKTITMPISSLSGTLETAALPEILEVLSMGDNKLRGTVDFTHLPSRIQEFSIYGNRFTGSAVLDSLPESLETMWIQDNTFSGTLCLTKLPPKIRVLDVSRNSFTGEFRLENPPVKLTNNFRAGLNGFSEIAIVPKDFAVSLTKSGVTAVVDAEGNPHPSESRII